MESDSDCVTLCERLPSCRSCLLPTRLPCAEGDGEFGCFTGRKDGRGRGSQAGRRTEVCCSCIRPGIIRRRED